MMMMIGRQTIHHQVPNGGELAVGVIQVPMWHQLLSKKKRKTVQQGNRHRCRKVLDAEREREKAPRERVKVDPP
jgi:hypothetical protein